jgi:hypothetical protein
MRDLSRSISIVFLLLVVVTGCVENAVSVKNPEYSDRTLKKTAILVLGDNVPLSDMIESELITLLNSRNVQVIGLTKEVAFSRTNEDIEALRKKLISEGVYEILYVKIGIFCEEDVSFSGGLSRKKCQPSSQYDQKKYTLRYPVRNTIITCRIDDFTGQSGMWNYQFTLSGEGILLASDVGMVRDAVNTIDSQLVTDDFISKKTYKNPYIH